MNIISSLAFSSMKETIASLDSGILTRTENTILVELQLDDSEFSKALTHIKTNGLIEPRDKVMAAQSTPINTS